MPPKSGRNPFKLNKNNAYHLLIICYLLVIVYQSFSFVYPQAKASRQHRSQALCAEELPQVADRPGGITCPERCWAAITWASRCQNTKISQRSPGEVSNDDETFQVLHIFTYFTSFQSWATHQAKYTKPSFCGACCAATRWCQVGNTYLIVSRISLIWHSVLSRAHGRGMAMSVFPMLIMYKLELSWTWIFSRNNQSAAGFPYEYRMNPWVRLKSGPLGQIITLVVPHFGSLMITKTLVVECSW